GTRRGGYAGSWSDPDSSRSGSCTGTGSSSSRTWSTAGSAAARGSVRISPLRRDHSTACCGRSDASTPPSPWPERCRSVCRSRPWRAGRRAEVTDGGEPRKRRILRLCLWILLGLLLRTVALGGDGLWCDEAYTAWRAHLPAEELERVAEADDAPPLYYAIQRILIPALPPGEESVRLLSAVAGVAGIVWLAAFPPIRAVVEIPVAFFAAGTFGVQYGRQARSYSLLMLWAAILMTATARVLEGRRRWLVVVVLAEAAALWSHNVAVTLVAGANFAWLVGGRRDPAGWIAAQAAAFLLWLPVLIPLLDQIGVHGELNRWIGEYWRSVPLAAAPLLSLQAFTTGARTFPPVATERWQVDGPGATAVTILALASVVVLLVAAFRRRREARFAAAFCLGPLVVLTVLSLATTPSYILGRTDAVAYVGFTVWAAIGLAALPSRARWIPAAVLAGATLLAVATNLPVGDRGRGNDRSLAGALRERTDSGDWIAFGGLSRPSFEFYLTGGRPATGAGEAALRTYPASMAVNPAAVFPTPRDSLRRWEEEARDLRRRFERTAPEPDSRFWYVGPIALRAPPDPTAQDLPYPGNLLAYALNGLRPLEPLGRARGDRMNADWIVFSVARSDLIPLDALEPVEVAD
ncbi:MAG: hypothetical protein GF328_13450, partial [Candidatus Latescibacteria bacterium]|nr:hypothetical protein [Candidatus Latescibacterota bacterium]